MKREDKLKSILEFVPKADEETVRWDELEKTALGSIFQEMRKIEQDPEYHGEGNVYEHTKLVCDALIELPIYKECSDRDRSILFLSALLHDIGKVRCTKREGSHIISPGHAKTGARMARAFMFEDLGMAGNSDIRSLREAVALMIKYHSFPPFAMKSDNVEQKLMKIAANGELTADFSLKKLCALETADALGRIGKSSDDYLERIEYCSMLAEELGISDSPYKFSTPYTERAYFLGKTNWREGELYKPNDFEVIMMAGLPGTGKDTWIAKNHPDLPVVSLDDIREKYGISPIGPQGEVISIALGAAREHLRKKQPFIWNATSAVYDLRSKISYMFEEYGASVKTVFLETAWDVCLARNNSRDRVVPEDAIRKMLGRFEVPERYESEFVEWITV